MLLPALTKARAKARDVNCMNQLRQLGLSFIQYADDNTGRTPHPYLATAGMNWTKLLFTTGYLTEPAAFLCPSDNRANLAPYRPSTDGAFDFTNCSYGVNLYLGIYGSNISNGRYANHASSMLMLADASEDILPNGNADHPGLFIPQPDLDGFGSNPQSWNAADDEHSGVPGFGWRHNGKTCNVVMLDGHVMGAKRILGQGDPDFEAPFCYNSTNN